MVDVHDKSTRSKNMAAITAKNTKPEILLRKALHKEKFRFRLNVKELPGSPDIVLPKYRTCIFVNGCFWHMHDCEMFVLPKSNIPFWKEKLSANKKRDKRNYEALIREHWKIILVWECCLKGRNKISLDTVIERIRYVCNSEAHYDDVIAIK